MVEKDNKIIGHINYSTGFIDYGGEKIDTVVLGPVSVDKKHQNQGVGSKLISFTLSLAENKKIPFVLVIGDENYYHRFGLNRHQTTAYSWREQTPMMNVRFLWGLYLMKTS